MRGRKGGRKGGSAYVGGVGNVRQGVDGWIDRVGLTVCVIVSYRIVSSDACLFCLFCLLVLFVRLARDCLSLTLYIHLRCRTWDEWNRANTLNVLYFIVSCV